MAKTIFWNVDTQFDFVEPQGKLYVQGAELLKSKWKYLTKFAKETNITVVNTCDWHNPDSNELNESPDFISTFPPHCMANTPGAEFVDETKPEDALDIFWNDDLTLQKKIISESRNIIIRKDVFDVFAGNPFTDKILEIINPQRVIIYGVTTNVCVNDAVVGLSNRAKEVLVIEDAIKELPKIPLPFENWEKLGVKLIQLKDLNSVI